MTCEPEEDRPCNDLACLNCQSMSLDDVLEDPDKAIDRIDALVAEVQRLRVAIEEEREACANAVEKYEPDIGEDVDDVKKWAAAAIRARKDQP